MTTAVLLLAAGTSACTGGDDEEPAASSSDTSESPEAVAEPVLDVTVGEVTGTLSKAVRRSATATTGRVVQTWLRAAYVGGTFPRQKFGNATLGMTAGASAQAKDDSALTSNAGVAAQIESLEVSRMRASVDLLGRDGRAAGATARFTLTYTTEGEYAATDTVTGRLYLTPGTVPKKKGVERDAWRIFGYDVARSAR